jgi:type VI secretion system protein ImpC
LNAPAAALAEAVSLAIRIEPQLLRKMRLELFPAMDAGAEADLWFSPVIDARSPSGIVLHPVAAQLLRRRLGANPVRLESSWRVTESLHRNISPAIFAEERLAYYALAGRYEDMRELLRSIVATLVSPRGRDLAGWAAQAIGRLPDEAKNSEEAQMLAFGASLRLGDSALLQTAPQRVTEWAGWLSPDDLETVPFGVTLLEDAVEFGPAGRPLSNRIALPKTVPILVQLSRSDGKRERRERVVLKQQSLTIVEIEPGVPEFDIRTVLGDSYRLTVPRKRESLQKKLSRRRPPRVRITYDVATGSAIEQKELPFVVGVLADLSGHPQQPLPPLRDRKFIAIDQDNFDQVIAAVNPALSVNVENRLAADGGSLGIHLLFRSLADFEPAQVARQVPPLRELLERRMLIAEVRTRLAGNDKLEATLGNVVQQAGEAPRANQAPAFRETVRMLEEAGGVTSKRAEELVAAFVENVYFPSGSRDLESAANARLTEIDARLSEQLRDILHHPDFQALESTWRGLRYLVMQTETSEMLKIRVWNVSKRDLAREFARVTEFDQTAIFGKIYEAEYGSFVGEPFGLLVGSYEFGQSSEDLELLENISRVAAAAHAPFVAAASPHMLRLENFQSLGTVHDLIAIFDSPQSERWNNFRASEDSRYVGLTLPRVLLRLTYGSDTVTVDEFDFSEMVTGSDQSQFLWGTAAFALAARITDGFARYGWFPGMHGVEDGGLVEGLPVFTFLSDDGEIAVKCPTEIAITDRREVELSWAGFIPLVHVKNADYAGFFHVNSARKPLEYENSAATANDRVAIQLPYVLAASRFAHYLRCIMRDKIGAFMSRREAEVFLNQWIRNYVNTSDESSADQRAMRPLREARIEIGEIAGRPGMYRAVAFLRPSFLLEDLSLALRVVIDLPGPAK